MDFKERLENTGESDQLEMSNLKVKSSDLILFTTQLSIMIDSGVVLSDAIGAIAEQSHPGNFRDIIEDIAERIKNGDSFSKALANYPKVFNAMFISMVKASEASGKMPEMLTILSGYINDDDETKKKVKGAMIYPFVMMISSIAATGSLMFFVLPRFTKIYESKGAALPKLTGMLVAVSRFFSNKTAMGLTLTALGIFAVWFHFWRQTTAGRKVIDWIKLHIPIFRTMFIDAVLTRSMRIMATMVNTGVSILDAIEVMKTSSDNYYFTKLWAATDHKIRDGYQLSESIVLAPYSHLVAPGIIQMLKAGEKSGKLGEVAGKISVFYEKKLAASIKAATSMIEPIMIIVMGSVIGTIAIALLLPVFKISSVMRG